jgi:hypothetical protein
VPELALPVLDSCEFVRSVDKSISCCVFCGYLLLKRNLLLGEYYNPGTDPVGRAESV